jgi:hypothetical protein
MIGFRFSGSNSFCKPEMDDPVMEFLADEGMGGGPPLDTEVLLEQVRGWP